MPRAGDDMESLAQTLLNYRRTSVDTDQVKIVDLHQAQQIIHDPIPLLDALVEVGVL